MDGIEHPARLTVGVVGAGRVGAVLGAALARAGHRVVAVVGRERGARRERAETLLPGVPLVDVARCRGGAPSWCCSTVPDDALPDLVAGLTATGAWQAGPDRGAHRRAGTASACWNRRRAHHVHRRWPCTRR